ncbi:MAG: glycosyltransferase, partial [Hyphomicrobiales bacterium]
MGAQVSDPRPIVIAAGGTGGHLFPAQALAQELTARGHVIHLMTDSRVDRHAAAFPGEEIHEIPSATFGLSKPLRIPPALVKLYRG